MSLQGLPVVQLPGPSGGVTGGGGASVGSGQVLSQLALTDTEDGIGYAVRLIDGQLRVVGTTNGEALSQLVMLEGSTAYVIKLVGGQFQIVGTL